MFPYRSLKLLNRDQTYLCKLD